jgi:kynurenine formamidase
MDACWSACELEEADEASYIVNLAQLPPRCQFFAPFYRFAGIDSALARAFALVEE